jgi:hypothetical protein
MRPVLHGNFQVTQKTGAGHDTADDEIHPGHTSYADISDIWPTDVANGKRNPWHKKIDDIMFYL